MITIYYLSFPLYEYQLPQNYNPYNLIRELLSITINGIAYIFVNNQLID